MNPAIQPVFCPPRKLSPAILTEVKKLLEMLCSEEINPKFKESTEWCSTLVIARQKNRDIIICIDLVYVNSAVRRPICRKTDVQDIFSRIDKSSFIQDSIVPLHSIRFLSTPDSQKLLTFTTPIGRYRWSVFHLAFNPPWKFIKKCSASCHLMF